MKQIIVCIDGTWNEPGQIIRPPAGFSGDVPTNVYRIWNAFGGVLDGGSRELGKIDQSNSITLIYVRGVGTQTGWLSKRIQGATGIGTAERVAFAYHLLSKCFTKGDKLYLFGFSRGAFAVRSLASMLHHMGIVAETSPDKARDMVDTYRSVTPHRINSVPVEYMGVWDTVGAIPNAGDSVFKHDINPINVRSVRHALALDEIREQYAPEYWLKPNGSESDVTESWFIGAHANIGGGYADANLSNIALFWILRGAQKAGLKIDARRVFGYEQEKESPPVDSWREFWKTPFIGTIIKTAGLYKEKRKVQPGQRFHESVLEAIAQSKYTPTAVTHEDTMLTPQLMRTRTAPWEYE
ncbi:DUF2235 domain-containing protein [Shinella zoogloeoides]